MGKPQHINASNIIRRFFSARVVRIKRNDAIRSRCIQIQRQHAGRAMVAPICILVAALVEREARSLEQKTNVPMSHHTGTTIFELSIHIMELIPNIILDKNSQATIDSVAIFLARQCHGNGTRQSAAATKAPMGSSMCITTTSCRE
jgi:hypothetical protein